MLSEKTSKPQADLLLNPTASFSATRDNPDIISIHATTVNPVLTMPAHNTSENSGLSTSRPITSHDTPDRVSVYLHIAEDSQLIRLCLIAATLVFCTGLTFIKVCRICVAVLRKVIMRACEGEGTC